MVPAPWSIATCGCATRRSRGRGGGRLRQAVTTVDFDLARRPARAKTSTSFGAPCSRASCRWRRIATAPLSFGRARAVAHAASCGRPRAGASRLRAGAVLGDQGVAGPRRRHARGGCTPRAASALSTDGDGAARRPGRRPAEVTAYKAKPRKVPSTGPVQHHGAHERGLGERRLPGAGHAGGRVALPRRSRQLPAHRQHRVSRLARPAGQPARAGVVATRRHGRRAASPQGQLTPTRGKKRTTDHPPIYPVGVPKKELSGDRGQGLRPRRAPLSGDLVASCDHRGSAPGREDRAGAVPRPRQPRGRARLSGGLREILRAARPAAAAS